MDKAPEVVTAVRLDLGCGKRKREGFVGVDAIAFEGVDLVLDLVERELVPSRPCIGNVQDCHLGEFKPWPWEANSVDEVFSSHFLEHLTGTQRVHFFNELWRVLKPGASATIITPDWSHACAYGDPTHQWPPLSSWYVLYLNKAWREVNAPHTGYICDFDWTTGGSWDEWLHVRNMETRMFAMQRYINSQRDLHVTLTRRP